MSVLYLLTAPPPPIEGTDAVFQEVAALRAAFQGDTFNLYPFARPSGRIPKCLYGLHAVGRLRARERDHRLNHVYFAVPYVFPVLRVLRNPLIYTVTASCYRYPRPRNLTPLRALHRIVVSNDRDAAALQSWGLTNVSIIRPGIDTTRLTVRPLPPVKELVLLMASAPWVPRQFDLKGLDAVLETAARLPFVRLILLWRGLLLAQLKERVHRFGLAERVEIVDRKVDVNAYLARAHAAVLLAKEADIVKAYPHSLLEALAAGKPVITSEGIPIADFVRKHQCGLAIKEVSSAALVAAITDMRDNYLRLANNAERVGPKSFSLAVLIDQHRRLYAL
jgi:glycosyltransferase involved in cell wall biosynthesis